MVLLVTVAFVGLAATTTPATTAGVADSVAFGSTYKRSIEIGSNCSRRRQDKTIVTDFAPVSAQFQSREDRTSTFLRHGRSTRKCSHRRLSALNGDGATDDLNIWAIDDDREAFTDLSHPGYSLESDAVTHVGGWLAHRVAQESSSAPPCWIQEVADKLTRYDYSNMPIGRPPRILVLYGSLRPTSYSCKLAYEFARLLEVLGCDVRTYNPQGLPVRDPALEGTPKVVELRSLALWSDGHMWVSPELHGAISGCFKNQIDWIPLSIGSVRPTQGKTCCVAQVNGGAQSFNVVNTLRLLARWMRMPCCTNQSSVPKAWQEFDDENGGRMKASAFRDRVVDVAEEFAKFTAVMAPLADDLTDRYSERKEREAEGRLLTQAEKEARKSKK